MVITPTQRKALKAKTEAYHEQLLGPEGLELYEYLTDERGFTPKTIAKFQLGAVLDPLEGDGGYVGRIAFPYFTTSGPVAMRYRIGPGQQGPKFLQPAGSHTTMYNVLATVEHSRTIIVCEGEPDTISAAQCGLPAVGIPGASAWKPHYRAVLAGFDKTIIVADNDDGGAGAAFAEKIANAGVPSPVIMTWPQGHDLNSFMLEHGADEVRSYLKMNPGQTAAAA